MAYTTLELITNAYYLSGLVSSQFQTVTGYQENQGLNLLNDVLGIKTANTRLIPFYKQYDFVAVVGQQKYFIPNLVQWETFTFFIGPIRYSMQWQSRKKYFGPGRVENIQSLPNQWHVERTLNGSDLFIYFIPNTNYPLQLWGKFGLDSVTLGQDLELVYERNYIVYLRYALSSFICQENGISVPPQTLAELRELEEIITDISPLDLTMTKVSSLQKGTSLNYGDVTFGHGWRPG